MPATVIVERIGWTNSITVLRDWVRELRPVYRPVDPASRTTYQTGELAGCGYLAITNPRHPGGQISSVGKGPAFSRC